MSLTAKFILALVIYAVFTFSALVWASSDRYLFGNTFAVLALLVPVYAWVATKIIFKTEENNSPMAKYKGHEEFTSGKSFKEMTKEEKTEWINNAQKWLKDFEAKQEERRNKKKMLW